MVNDGSTDGSGEICNLYAERDRRFRVIHKENGGVSSARNLGMELLQGTYFCFVDSDDYVASNYISLLLKNLDAADCDLSVCGLSRGRHAEGANTVSVLNRHDALLSLFDGVRGIRGYIGGKLFRTAIMKKHTVMFDEGQALAEDLLFIFEYLRFCREENSVCVSARALYYYEKQSGGVLAQRGRSDTFSEKWCDLIAACDKILLKIPPEDQKLRQAVKLEKVMQCVTLIRIMAKYGLKERCSAYKKYVFRNLGAYLFSKSFSARKKIGAVAVLVCPQYMLKRR